MPRKKKAPAPAPATETQAETPPQFHIQVLAGKTYGPAGDALLTRHLDRLGLDIEDCAAQLFNDVRALCPSLDWTRDTQDHKGRVYPVWMESPGAVMFTALCAWSAPVPVAMIDPQWGIDFVYVTVRRFVQSDEARASFDWRVHGCQKLPPCIERPFSLIGHAGQTLQSAHEKALETAKIYQAKALNPVGGFVASMLKKIRGAQ